MSEHSFRSLLRALFTLAFALLISLSVFLENGPSSILYPQDFFAVLAGTCLGGIQGSSAAGLYIIAGCAGLKVFPGFSSGFKVFGSTAGGLLAGCFTGALASGLISGKPLMIEKQDSLRLWIKLFSAATAGFMIELFCIFLSAWNLEELNQIDFIQLTTQTAAKISVCVPLSFFARTPVARLLYPSGKSAEKEAEELIGRVRGNGGNK